MKLSDSEIKRYNRQIILSEIGLEGQLKLKQTKVLVIGAGGLGCPVLQYLTTAGVGQLGIVDPDVISVSNLPRQILFGQASTGKSKATEAKNRLSQLNDYCKINAYDFALNQSNVLQLFDQYDIIVDGTDNFPTRYLINDAAVCCNKPVVYGAVYTFEGQVSVFNYNNGPTYRCLFPLENTLHNSPNCQEAGVLASIAGITGLYMANEVLKIILQQPHILSGELIVMDALGTTVTKISISRSKQSLDTAKHEFNIPDNSIYKWQCSSTVQELSIDEVNELQHNGISFQWIDVRNKDEFDQRSLFNAIQIPLPQLHERIKEIDSQKTVLVFCQSGNRSKSAYHIIKQYSTDIQVYSLEGGINSMKNQTLIKNEQ